MRKEDKNTIIESLAANVSEYNHFYVTDTAGLDAGATSDLRRLCFKKEVKMIVVKNTIFQKALENSETDYAEIFSVLEGPSTVLFSNTGNTPAKLIKEFAKKHKKPILKGAYVEESVYIGEDRSITKASRKPTKKLKPFWIKLKKKLRTLLQKQRPMQKKLSKKLRKKLKS